MMSDAMKINDVLHAVSTAELSAKSYIPTAAVAAAAAADTTIEGCYLCHLNNHQDQILLCEHCNGEYHTYCLRPPLKSIPDYDWYCGKEISHIALFLFFDFIFCNLS
jgi:hypothetical protein